jgi:hypothetical protein
VLERLAEIARLERSGRADGRGVLPLPLAGIGQAPGVGLVEASRKREERRGPSFIAVCHKGVFVAALPLLGNGRSSLSGISD